MMYNKIDWNEETTPLSESNLNHMETQYDEINNYLDSLESEVEDNFQDIQDTAPGVKRDETIPLIAEIVSSLPSHNEGRFVYLDGDKFYVSDGSNWLVAALEGEDDI